jgi:hypothetical protein
MTGKAMAAKESVRCSPHPTIIEKTDVAAKDYQLDRLRGA